MSKKQKLIDKAEKNPQNVSFRELCRLAELYGFEFKRQNATSHKIYTHPKMRMALPLQADKKIQRKPKRIK